MLHPSRRPARIADIVAPSEMVDTTNSRRAPRPGGAAEPGGSASGLRRDKAMVPCFHGGVEGAAPGSGAENWEAGAMPALPPQRYRRSRRDTHATGSDDPGRRHAPPQGTSAARKPAFDRTLGNRGGRFGGVGGVEVPPRRPASRRVSGPFPPMQRQRRGIPGMDEPTMAPGRRFSCGGGRDVSPAPDAHRGRPATPRPQAALRPPVASRPPAAPRPPEPLPAPASFEVHHGA